MCFCIGHWLAACIGPQHWNSQPSNPSLKEQLSNALIGDQWTGK